MAESAANAYATKSDNTAATAPTPVAVVNDGVADRQIVVLGSGDGTTNIQDGSAAHPIRTDPTGTTTQPVSGSVSVSNFPATQPVSGTVAVSNLPATQPVSAASLPLPTGAATAANQASIKSDLDEIALDTDNLAGIKTDLDSVVTNTTGLATAANQATANSSLSTIATNTAANATAANQTNGNQKTQVTNIGPSAGIGDVRITDQTNTVGVVAPGTANSSGNALLTAETSYPVTFSVTSVSAGTTYDVGNYGSVSVQVTAQYTGTTPTITFQCSDDGTNWYSNALTNSGSGNSPQNSTTATGLYKGPLSGRYFRLNFTGTYSSGTSTGLIVFSTASVSPLSDGVTQVGTWNVGSNSATGSAVPANAFYAGFLGSSGNLVGAVTAQGVGDGSTGANELVVVPAMYNGSTYDKTRSASAASNTTGTGLLGVGILGFDGTNYQRLQVDGSNRLQVTTAPLSASTDAVTNTPVTASTGTPTSVASSATSVTILASNTARKGALVYNDSTQVLYLLLSTGTASNSNYSVQIPAGGYYEVPGPTVYSGQLTGIWASANGNARVTELT